MLDYRISIQSAVFYEALGLTRERVEKDPSCVKTAYRKLALELDPDKTGTADSERFQTISRAYQVLSDDDLRVVIDTYTVLPMEPEEILQHANAMFPGMETETAVGILKLLVPEPSWLESLSPTAFNKVISDQLMHVGRFKWIRLLAGCVYLLILIHNFLKS